MTQSAVTAPAAPPWRGMTRTQYDALVATGVLETEHVELVEGDLIEMVPQGSGHSDVIVELTRWLVPRVGDPWRVRPQTPLAAGDRSQPEPDLAIARRSDGHPHTAALVIEVAVTSQPLDLQVKPAIYAAADVVEYWVIDVPAREVVVHSDPGPTGYRMVRRHSWNQPLTVPIGNGVPVDLAELLGP